MFSIANPYKAYQAQQQSRSEVEFLSPQQQISALYNRCLELIDDSYELLGELSKSSEKVQQLNKAISIINYLQGILTNDGDLELYNMYVDLYDFIIAKLRLAAVENEAIHLDEGRTQVQALADIWQNISSA